MILKGFEELKVFLEKPRNIVVVGHHNPDGDAMGSTLALSKYLEKKGHTATVVVPNEYPAFLHWLPGSDATYRFDWQNSQSQRAIKNSEIIFYWILMPCTVLVPICKILWNNIPMILQ